MQKQNITLRTKGHHLTSFERGRITELHYAGTSNRQIASTIGVCPQTINNELQRGTVDQVSKVNGKKYYHRDYLPETAQERYELARLNSHRTLKVTKVVEFLTWFTDRFKIDHWSPDAAVGYAKRKHLFKANERVSTATLYAYINDQRLEIRNLDLLEVTRRQTKHHRVHKHKRVLGRSIEERSTVVNHRKQFGHWEMDTVVGKRGGRESVILSIIERKSRCQLLRLIDGRDADSVAFALQDIKQEYGDLFKTITADNGSEFATLDEVFSSSKTKIYYAHPYTSCDRGSNEAHNRMIRRDFPKGLSLDTVSPDQVLKTQDTLNRLPRRELGYHTPEELFQTGIHQSRRAG